MPAPATATDRRAPDADVAAREHHALPPLSDPGKEERAAEGVPVVPAFDGYRALAIMGILVFHVFANSGVLARAGGSLGGQLIWATGPQLVDVLFIVSGFVVFLPTVAQHGQFGSVKGYAIRRAARLLPAYWLSLGIMLLVFASRSGVPQPGFGDLASNFSGQQTLVNMIFPGTLIGFGLDIPIWTLTLEIGFYIVLPFIAAYYYRRPILGLLVALVIAVVWRHLFTHTGAIAGLFGIDLSATRENQLHLASISQLPSWAFSFAAGMTGAWAYVQLSRRADRAHVRQMARRVLIVSLPVFALCVYLAGRKAVGAPPGDFPNLDVRSDDLLSIGYTASLATTMVALTLLPRRRQMPFAHPLARKLGDISYGVYLIQAPLVTYLLFHIFHTLLSPDGSLWAFVKLSAIVFPVCLLYGYLSARFLEQPIRRWAHRFGRQAQSAAASPGDPAGVERAPAG